MLNLEEAREIWKSGLGFTPTTMGTFDHMTVGFPSRLLTGYLNYSRFCRTHALDEFRAVSICLDTIVPSREKPCGVSGELGIVSPEKTCWISDPHTFFFRNRFDFRFDQVRPVFLERLQKALNGANKQKRQEHYRQAAGWFELIALLWGGVVSGARVLESRRDLMESLGVSFKGKRRLLSELLPIQADVLEALIRQGVTLDSCPRVHDVGVARLIGEDGHEAEVVRVWDNSILDRMRSEKVKDRSAVLTAPLAILTTSFLFPHFGQDYGMLDEIASWLGVDPPLTSGSHDSWPVGELIDPRTSERLHGVWSDLFFWGSRENYVRRVLEALETGEPSFSHRLCDWQ